MKKFLITVIVLLILVGGGYLLQTQFHWLDEPLRNLNQYLKLADEQMSEQWIAGISFGTLIFIGILILIPLFSRQINGKIYFSNIRQGIVASFVFFGSQGIYSYIEKIGKIYMLLSIAAMSIITLILIQIGSKVFKNKETKTEFKSGTLASVTAGLIFGVLLNLITMVIDIMKTKI